MGQLRLAHRLEDRAGVERALARCRAYLRKNGDRWLAAHALAHMGLVLARAAPAEAETHLQRALRIATAVGDRCHQALAHLGLAYLRREDAARLAEHLPDAIGGAARYGSALLGGDFAAETAALMAAARQSGLAAAGLAPLVRASGALAGVAIHTFGSFAVTVAGRQVPAAAWRGSRARDLCKLLAARHPRPVPKDEVLETFWGHLTREAAENNFYKTLHLLRRVLDPSGRQPRDRYVTLRGGALGLAPDVWLDACAFGEHVERARRLLDAGDRAGARRELLAADQLYTGDFLADDPHAEWVANLCRYFQRQRAWVLEHLAAAAAAAGDHAEACGYLERLLAADPTQEAAHRRLVESLYRAGCVRQALEQYQRCCRVLRRELGVEPAAETQELAWRLFGVRGPGKVSVRSVPVQR